jgi:hypothetical protein
MSQAARICEGAAAGGCLAELMWLIRDRECPIGARISVPAAASGSVSVLAFLRQCDVAFTVETACSAAAAGHLHVIDYLHAESCAFDERVYLLAAATGHVHVLQRLRELACAWNSKQLCSLEAAKGLLPVLQWAKQQGAVFDADNMAQAALFGHTAVCEYLHSQQCPCDSTACTAAAKLCHLSTLRWLLEYDCPYIARALWAVAAEQGYISVLSYLQQQGIGVTVHTLSPLLFIAGANSQLAAAQWLRAQGADWPGILSVDVDGELQQWEGAVLEWARVEGCTAPLH